MGKTKTSRYRVVNISRCCNEHERRIRDLRISLATVNHVLFAEENLKELAGLLNVDLKNFDVVNESESLLKALGLDEVKEDVEKLKAALG